MRRPELLAALDVSDRQLQRLLSAGLPFTPVGVRGQRFDLDECKAWLRAAEAKRRTAKAAAKIDAGVRALDRAFPC